MMEMATGEILSFSISHKPDLSFVMEPLHQVLPILKPEFITVNWLLNI